MVRISSRVFFAALVLLAGSAFTPLLNSVPTKPSDFSATVEAGGSIFLPFTGSTDADGDRVGYHITSGPVPAAAGSVTCAFVTFVPVNGGSTVVDSFCSFTASLTFSGTATITYVASDGLSDSAPATITIIVPPATCEPRLACFLASMDRLQFNIQQLVVGFEIGNEGIRQAWTNKLDAVRQAGITAATTFTLADAQAFIGAIEAFGEFYAAHQYSNIAGPLAKTITGCVGVESTGFVRFLLDECPLCSLACTGVSTDGTGVASGDFLTALTMSVQPTGVFSIPEGTWTITGKAKLEVTVDLPVTTLQNGKVIKSKPQINNRKVSGLVFLATPITVTCPPTESDVFTLDIPISLTALQQAVLDKMGEQKYSIPSLPGNPNPTPAQVLEAIKIRRAGIQVTAVSVSIDCEEGPSGGHGCPGPYIVNAETTGVGPNGPPELTVKFTLIKFGNGPLQNPTPAP